MGIFEGHTPKDEFLWLVDLFNNAMRKYYIMSKTQRTRMMGPVYHNRGIRLGDPLSLYLFILYANGLSE